MCYNLLGDCNVVIIDFPDPSTIELAKLDIRSFYLKVNLVLVEYGMMEVQGTFPYHAKESWLTD